MGLALAKRKLGGEKKDLANAELSYPSPANCGDWRARCSLQCARI